MGILGMLTQHAVSEQDRAAVPGLSEAGNMAVALAAATQLPPMGGQLGGMADVGSSVAAATAGLPAAERAPDSPAVPTR